jgi:hypothetical protein
VVVVGTAEDVFRILEGRHPLAVLEPRVPADVIDVQMGAHHHVDLVGFDAGRLQPRQVGSLHQVPLGPMRPGLVVANAGVDQDTFAADGQKPAMDAELQGARRLVVVIGQQPVAMFLHHGGLPVREEHLCVEVGLVGLLDALHRGRAQLHLRHAFPPTRAGTLALADGFREGRRFVR